MGSKQKQISKNSVGRLNRLAGVVMSLLVLLAGFYIFSSKSNAEITTLSLSGDASYTSEALSLYEKINLNGHHLTVTNNFTTDADITFGDDGKLTVNGNMTTSGHLLVGRQSTFVVSGNYTQRDGYFMAGPASSINISGNMSFIGMGYPGNMLGYGAEYATLTIGGDFIYNSAVAGNLPIKMMLAGNVTQDKDANKIVISSLNLNGNSTQTIAMVYGDIRSLSSTNTDIILDGRLYNTDLESDIYLRTTEKADFNGVTLKEGYILSVNGNLTASGHFLVGKESTLKVSGNYTQTDGYYMSGPASNIIIFGNMSFTGVGYPGTMLGYGAENAFLTIAGDFIYNSKKDGTLPIKTMLTGNVTQDQDAGKIVISDLNLNGNTTQTITVVNGDIRNLSSTNNNITLNGKLYNTTLKTNIILATTEKADFNGVTIAEGCKLSVNGNLTASGNFLVGKQSALEVSINYTQTDGYFMVGTAGNIKISGNMSFTGVGYPGTMLGYGAENAVLTIVGDFIYNSKKAGTLPIKTMLTGNVKQDKDANKIVISDLNLNGNNTQTIAVVTGDIRSLTSTNVDIILDGKLYNTDLKSDIKFKTTEKADFNGVTIAEGYKLSVDGNLTASGNLLVGTQSTLEVSGNYTQTGGYFMVGTAGNINISGNMGFTGLGYPGTMLGYGSDNASLTIGGDFIYNSSKIGVLPIKTKLAGNVTQDKEASNIKISNLNLTGKDTQTVTLPNGTITKLTLAAGKSHYTFTKADCFEKLIATSEVNFDADGGTVDTAKKNVTTEDKYGELPAPTKDGCVFDGWVIKDTDTVITSETVVTAVDDHTLVAKWKKDADDEGSPMYMEGKHLEWNEVDGKFYWYEDGVKQGTYYDPKGVIGDGTVRGREICDNNIKDSFGNGTWFWLDSVYHGAKAVGKEVWVPYIYQDEDKWSDEEKRNIANESDQGMGDLVYQYMQEKKGKWVRYDQDGRMLKGWVTIEGALAEKYPDQKGNTYYYDSRTGLMAKGNVTIDGVNHFFNETSGVLEW